MQAWLSLRYGYVKQHWRGICLRSLPGTESPPPDSQSIPRPSLKLSPGVMDLLRNSCFSCWMNICQKICRIFHLNCFLLEEEGSQHQLFLGTLLLSFKLFKKSQTWQCHCVLKSYLKSGGFMSQIPSEMQTIACCHVRSRQRSQFQGWFLVFFWGPAQTSFSPFPLSYLS